jgi:hypothetical protein
MTEQDDFAGLETFIPDLLPEGAVPLGGVVVVEYATAEGETEHAFQVLGDVRRVQAFGLLEVGKWLMFDELAEDDE